MNERVDVDIVVVHDSYAHANFSLDTNELLGFFDPNWGDVPETATNKKASLSFSLDFFEQGIAGEARLFKSYEFSDGDSIGASTQGAASPTLKFPGDKPCELGSKALGADEEVGSMSEKNIVENVSGAGPLLMHGCDSRPVLIWERNW